MTNFELKVIDSVFKMMDCAQAEELLIPLAEAEGMAICPYQVCIVYIKHHGLSSLNIMDCLY